MIVIWAKPGTHPAGYLRVKYKRKPPGVGDIFKAKPCDPYGRVRDPQQRWEWWYCDGIRGGLYLLERM